LHYKNYNPTITNSNLIINKNSSKTYKIQITNYKNLIKNYKHHYQIKNKIINKLNKIKKISKNSLSSIIIKNLKNNYLINPQHLLYPTIKHLNNHHHFLAPNNLNSLKLYNNKQIYYNKQLINVSK
jgi:hypothetical protein